jgi:hypothetical protein
MPTSRTPARASIVTRWFSPDLVCATVARPSCTPLASTTATACSSLAQSIPAVGSAAALAVVVVSACRAGRGGGLCRHSLCSFLAGHAAGRHPVVLGREAGRSLIGALVALSPVASHSRPGATGPSGPHAGPHASRCEGQRTLGCDPAGPGAPADTPTGIDHAAPGTPRAGRVCAVSGRSGLAQPVRSVHSGDARHRQDLR